jgi:hypothetical protein
MKRVFSIVFALALVVSLGLVTASPVLAAGTIRVPGDYPTIQQAVDAAGPGDTITVAAGTYAAFQVIGKNNIHIIGAEGATVTTTNLYRALPVVGNAWVLAAVYDSEDVNIEGINFDGTGVSGKTVVVGLAYVDSTGSVADLTVENIFGTDLSAGVAIIGDVGTSVVNLSGVTVQNSMAGVAICNAEANLDGCTITDMLDPIWIGWPCDGLGPSTVTMQGSTISNNDGGIYVCDDSTLGAHFNNIADNTVYGVRNDGGGMVDATYNWWGHASGPYHETLNPDGRGNEVIGNVDFEPWLETEVVTKTVTNGRVDAKAVADTEVEVDGTATATIARYPDNPGGDAPTDFISLGKYTDVYVPDTTEVRELEIRLYYTDAELAVADIGDEESLRLFWWNGDVWNECSDAGVNTASTEGYSGYMWAKITATTTPTLSQLTGTPWGGYGHPTEKGICFIATAAYGSDTAKEIDILREFRDTLLLPNSLGAEFVSLYYAISPPAANFISQHEVLRKAVRVGFVEPIVKILNWSHHLWSARG